MRVFSRTRRIRRCQNVVRSPGRTFCGCEIAFGRGISPRMRDVVSSQVELYCQMCGVFPGDIDDLTGRRVRFHVGRIKAKSFGGTDELSNLRSICTTCYRGAKELYKERTSDNALDRAFQGPQRPTLSSLIKEIGDAR
jgi:hypothetical protein